MSFLDDLPESVCRRNAPLGPLTWFRLGGPAQYLVSPGDESALAEIIRRCRQENMPWRLLGLGANVLAPDEGVRGAVIRLDAPAFRQERVEEKEGRIVAGAGVDLAKLVVRSVKLGLSGLENLAGIPGTVGGGIRMNCGGKYGEIGTIVDRVRVVDADGSPAERKREDLRFAYRRCALNGDVVTEATFRLAPMDPAALDRRFREIWNYKQSTQPPLGAASAGCIFRNPEGHSAGALIDLAGLKGFRVGSARISEQHANFIVSEAGGRAADVLSLIRTIVRRVEAESGIRLEPEVDIWVDDCMERDERETASRSDAERCTQRLMANR